MQEEKTTEPDVSIKIAIIGARGVGKTTLIRWLARTINPGLRLPAVVPDSPTSPRSPIEMWSAGCVKHESREEIAIGRCTLFEVDIGFAHHYTKKPFDFDIIIYAYAVNNPESLRQLELKLIKRNGATSWVIGLKSEMRPEDASRFPGSPYVVPERARILSQTIETPYNYEISVAEKRNLDTFASLMQGLLAETLKSKAARAEESVKSGAGAAAGAGGSAKAAREGSPLNGIFGSTNKGGYSQLPEGADDTTSCCKCCVVM